MRKFGGLRAKSFWKAEVLDAGGHIISLSDFMPNVMTNEGLAFWLDVMFKGAVIPSTDWYIMIFSDNATPTADSTYAVKGVTEYSGYTEATRPIFQSGDILANQITNSADPALFSITENVTIYGAGLVVGSSTKGNSSDTGAVLLAAAKFGAAQVLSNGTTLRVTATVTAQDG